MNEAMRKALEADGEKLRALTGRDHGPVFIESRFVPCPRCNEWDYGELVCTLCHGDGVIEEEVEPITLDDFERDWIWPICSHCGKADDGKIRGCTVGGCPLGHDT